LDGVLKQGMEVHVELKLSELEKGEKIGKGATGDVLAGKLKIENGKIVNIAIKIFDELSMSVPEEFAMFQKRSRIFIYFKKHPNILRCYGAGTSKAIGFFVVTELRPRGSLRDLLVKAVDIRPKDELIFRVKLNKV